MFIAARSFGTGARRRRAAGGGLLCRRAHRRRAACARPRPAPGVGTDRAVGRRLRSGYPAEVLRVIDGDTFEARVRIWPGMDVTTRCGCAASTRPSCTRAATTSGSRRWPRATALARILAEGAVGVSGIGQDKYGGRVDADVSTAGTPDVSAAMLGGGYARAYPAAGAKAGAAERAAISLPQHEDCRCRSARGDKDRRCRRCTCGCSRARRSRRSRPDCWCRGWRNCRGRGRAPLRPSDCAASRRGWSALRRAARVQAGRTSFCAT